MNVKEVLDPILTCDPVALEMQIGIKGTICTVCSSSADIYVLAQILGVLNKSVERLSAENNEIKIGISIRDKEVNDELCN